MKARRPLKVLQLCAVDFTVRQFIAPVAQALQAAGYATVCACSPGPHRAEIEAMGVRLLDVELARSANPIKALGAIWRVWKLIRKERPDVLHVHTPVASMIGRVAARLAGVPLIIYTAHGFYFHDRMPRGKRFAHIMLERIFGLLNHHLFCVSAEDARDAIRLHIARRRRVSYVPNGVDLTVFNPAAVGPEQRAAVREKLGIPKDAAVILIMGRLVREKGYAEFFEAARRLAPKFPHAHFLVVGDTVSSEHDSFKSEILKAAELPALAGRVHLAGLRRDIPDLLAAADIFTLPSYREGMPVSILEAMAMGLPVVATKIRGCREEVLAGDTGFLVTPGKVRGLQFALAWLLEHPDLAREMGQRGRERVRSHFDMQRTMARQVRLYGVLTRRLRR